MPSWTMVIWLSITIVALNTFSMEVAILSRINYIMFPELLKFLNFGHMLTGYAFFSSSQLVT